MGVDLKIGFCTVPDIHTAEKIASHFVSNKWAACVNIVPGIQSVYSWQGKIEKDNEVLMIVKTHLQASQLIQDYLDSEAHPYDCPEWVLMHVEEVKQTYGQWALNYLID